MIEIAYFIIGVLPCIVWLLFWISQDPHPEKTRKIFEIYFLGAMTTLPAILLEYPLYEIKNGPLIAIFCIFWVGIVEEGMKFLPVKFRVIKSPHFDEPFDALFYMVVSALGFASLENFFSILNEEYLLTDVLVISMLRFISAIMLHTIASAFFGFFIALGIKENKKFHFFGGFALASFLHAIYNLLVQLTEWQIEKFPRHPSSPFWPFLFVLGIGILLSLAILKVKKMPSICKIKKDG